LCLLAKNYLQGEKYEKYFMFLCPCFLKNARNKNLKPPVEKYILLQHVGQYRFSLRNIFLIATMKKYLSLGYAAFIYILLSAILCSAEQQPAKALPAAAQKNILFTFQVDAIANKDRAYVLEENLMDKGYPAYVEEVSDSTGKITYQVRVGKYQTREDAEKAARAYYDKEKKSYWITATQSAPAEQSAESGTAATPERRTDSSPKELSSTSSEKIKQEVPAASEKILEQQNSPRVTASSPPAVAEQKAEDARSAAPAPSAAKSSSDWPPMVTRIYTYYDPQGYLRITNSAEKIPDESQQKIESVSVYPVKYLSFNQKKKILVLDLAGKQEELQLAGVDLSASAAVKNAAAYFEKTLTNMPLRLKYTPAQDNAAPKKIKRGTLFLRQGASLNIELARLGIAPCDADSALPAQKQACSEAEAGARSAKAGIWAEGAHER
jgi:hypothetical protein